MKKLIIILMVGSSFAQQYEDVVILKNGSEIHGIIIEEKFNEYIKIQSGKNILVYRYDEIDLFRKELINKTKRYNLSDKTWSFAVGLGTNRNFSLLGFSKDLRIGNQFALFVTADIPIVITFGDGFGEGHALLGIGIACHENYNGKGFNLTNTLNYQMYDGIGGDVTHHSSIQYQWEIGSQSFISSGIMVGKYWEKSNNCEGSCPKYQLEEYYIPTISYIVHF